MSHDHEHESREYFSNMSANCRHVSADRMRQFEGYMAEILTAFGMNPDTPATRGTPPLTRTTFWRGNYESDASLRTEFFVACGLHRFEPGSR